MGCPDQIIPDGKIHRFQGAGDKAGAKNGFYVLYADGTPAGAYGNWRTQPEAIKWRAQPSEPINLARQAELKAQLAAAKKERAAEEAAKHASAAQQAQAEWDAAKNAHADYPYLCEKKVGTHGIKETADGRLIVPVYDIITGKIVSVQHIDQTGAKKFLFGSAVAGGYYHLGVESKKLIVIATGFATAATICEARPDASVLMAFSDSNILAVAKAERKKNKRAKIIIAADNDLGKTKEVAGQEVMYNPGLEAAQEAAEAVNGLVAIPTRSVNPEKKCDWNDIASAEGIEVVKAAFDTVQQLIGAMADRIEVKPIEWEWHERIPRGEVTVVDGDPGLGKSIWSLDLAARKSIGGIYPGGEQCKIGNSILISAEDTQSTIILRLLAAGADLSKIRLVESAFETAGGELEVLTLPDHADRLEELIRADKAELLVIDPLSAFVSEKVDSHRDSSIRRVLAHLARLAHRTGCAIILIRHLNKQASLANAIYRGGGSIAIIGQARAGFLIGLDPTDKNPEDQRRVFAHNKFNLLRRMPSLAFRVLTGENDQGVAHLEWDREPCNLTADDLLMTAPKPRNSGALDRAKEFLQLELANGPRPSIELEALARSKDITDSTHRRATKALRLDKYQEEFHGPFFTALPGARAKKEI